MEGSLDLFAGILYVGRHAKTARVRSFDLDGHVLETHLEFRDEDHGRSSASGLAVDTDHRIWVADEAGERLLGFTLFGQEVAQVVESSREDRAGSLGAPVDVVARGSDEELTLIVASAGVRRHSVQELHPASGYQRSLRPLGDPEGTFRDVTDLAIWGDDLFVCERRSPRIQVFRQGEFHYTLTLPGSGAQPGTGYPTAVAPVGDGRLVVAVSGERSAVLLMDAAGRLQRVLASEGDGDGDVQDPCDLVLERAPRDHDARLAVLDQAAERVQILTLDGVCFGTFPSLR